MASVAEERERRLATEPLRSAGPRRGAFAGTLQSFRDVFSRRELLLMLVKRELKARYKDSTLGFLWSTIRPLVMLLVYVIVIGQFLGASRTLPMFPIYLYSGLTAWNFFQEAVQSGTGSVVANAGLVKKVFLPREVFPFSAIGSALFNFGIQLAILLAATVVLGDFPIGLRWIYFIPAMVNLILYATLMALALSALNVYLRDIQYLVEVFLMIFMWASPIMYSWTQVWNTIAKHPNNLLLNIAYHIYCWTP
jgi:ABC-2 type transport system permease protein